MMTFTLEQAQALLPEARQRINEASATLSELRRLLGLIRDNSAPVGAEQTAQELEAVFDATMAWFTQQGIQVKGLAPALLDFPARAIRDGEPLEVLLCWRDDEDAIAYCHTPETGYRAREPIAMLDTV